MRETRARSVSKSLSWRALATLTTIVLVWTFTGQMQVAVAVGSAEVVAKLVIFYAHERAWASLRWGFKAPRR